MNLSCQILVPVGLLLYMGNSCTILLLSLRTINAFIRTRRTTHPLTLYNNNNNNNNNAYTLDDKQVAFEFPPQTSFDRLYISRTFSKNFIFSSVARFV